MNAKPAAAPAALVEQQQSLIASLTAESERLRSHVEDLERLRDRAKRDTGNLRAELQLRADALDELQKNHALLQHRFVLATDQLNALTVERFDLEQHCKRLERADAAARERVLAAERSLHDHLIGFADDLSSLAEYPAGVLYVNALRERTATILDQLERVNAELATVGERLAKREGSPLERAFRRIARMRTFKRVRALVRR